MPGPATSGVSPNIPSYSAGLHAFALITAGVTVLLVCAGGLVTSHEAGMAVPDWPNSFGYTMFAFPFSKWLVRGSAGGIFYEHSHRLIASFAGLMTTILSAWLWCRETKGRPRWLMVLGMAAVLGLMGVRQLPVYIAVAVVALGIMGWSLVRAWHAPETLRWMGLLAFGAVLLQGILGGLRVVLLRDQIGIFHATLAQLFLLLICVIAFLTSRFCLAGPRSFSNLVPVPAVVHRLFLAGVALILFQLLLGATMRHQHAGLAIPDFPLAYGKLWPAMDADAVAAYNQQRIEIMNVKPITGFQVALQMVHRLLACGILTTVCAAAFLAAQKLGRPHPLTKISLAWLGVVLAQGCLGAATIWTNKAADVATTHVLFGAASLVTGALGCLLIQRLFPRSSGFQTSTAPFARGFSNPRQPAIQGAE